MFARTGTIQPTCYQHPVFGPDRQSAALAAINELAATESVMTGWPDYDTAAMVQRRNTARDNRSYYSEYGSSFDEHAMELITGADCKH